MKLSNPFATAHIQPLGAMLRECAFHLGDGRTVHPLFDAPWRGDVGPEFEALPPIIQELGSEWPCVPFGRPGDALSLPDEWKKQENIDQWDPHPHGYASNHMWTLERNGNTRAIASIDYPKDAPIKRLQRQVQLLDDRPGLALTLTIEARRDVSLPIGLHPVLSMAGAAPQSLSLQLPDSARSWSFPIDVEPGRSHFAPNQQNRPLNEMRNSTGEVVDARLLPPEGKSEDLLLIAGTGGRVCLSNSSESYRVTIGWDAEQLPGCALWISNGGRDYYPWNSRVAALGIEPVAAAFDLGLGHSLSTQTPLAQNGIGTAISVTAASPFNCQYQIEVDSM